MDVLDISTVWKRSNENYEEVIFTYLYLKNQEQVSKNKVTTIFPCTLCKQIGNREIGS